MMRAGGDAGRDAQHERESGDEVRRDPADEHPLERAEQPDDETGPERAEDLVVLHPDEMGRTTDRMERGIDAKSADENRGQK